MKNTGVANLNIKSIFQDRSSNELDYGFIFDEFQDGVCILNEHGYITYINKAYERMFKVSNSSEVGSSAFQTRYDDVVLTAFRDRKCVSGRIRYHEGKSRIKASASPMFLNGKFAGVAALYREESQDGRPGKKDGIIELNSPYNCEDTVLEEPFKKIIGRNLTMRKVLSIACKASKTSSTVLVRGESGTGKELVARAIHESSERAHGPYVTVNCGAIPSTLLEAELFGYEQGAFTGALKTKQGKFEHADGGTIFLDEIGDMPIDMQVKLLRVLQEREFERVGGTEIRKCDVRIIAATNRNLEELIGQGKFREDLYYRLNVIPIYLPSLKERQDDIPLLIKFFINMMNDRMGKSIKGMSSQALECMCRYDWPGNVRELENIIERASALTEDETIGLSDIPPYISGLYDMNMCSNGGTLINMGMDGKIATFEEYEREIIMRALEKYGSFNAAGKALGITHKTVALKARKYNLI